MKLFSGIEQEVPTDIGNTVATIGNFDGIHKGHQALLAKLIEQSKLLKEPSLVILFEPQPGEYFLNENSPVRLYSLREKLNILRVYGIDFVCCLRFDKSLSLTTPVDFARRYLFGSLNIKYLLIGNDFHFGFKREGNVALLDDISHEFGASVNVFSDYIINSERVSSTRIRKTLQSGDISTAVSMLGRDYSICGRVIHGAALGRTWGIPTANIKLNRRKTALNGVYCVRVKRQDGTILDGVANIGNRPTVDGSSKAILEVHLLDFNECLYGEMLQVIFIYKLREEIKFSSVDMLVGQIHKDIASSKIYFQKQVDIIE